MKFCCLIIGRVQTRVYILCAYLILFTDCVDEEVGPDIVYIRYQDAYIARNAILRVVVGHHQLLPMYPLT